MIRLTKKYLKGIAILTAILAPFSMFVEVFMDLMQPKLLEDIIDIGIANKDLHYVYVVGAKMCLMAVLGFLGGAGCSIFSSIAATNLATELRQGLFDKIQTFSFKEIDKLKTSSLITRLTNDITQVQNMFNMVLRGAVRAPLLCIGGMFMAFYASPKLATIFAVAVPTILIATILILKYSFPLFTLVQVQIDKVNMTMRESILGVRVIKALTLERNQGIKFKEANDELMEESMRAQNINMLLWPIVTFVMNLSIVAVLFFGGHMVNQKSLEVGKIVAFVNYLIQITSSLIMVVTLVLNFSRAKASADRINEVFDTETQIKNKEITKTMQGYDLEFKHVSFSYSEHSKDVLSDINIKIKQGEKIGIIGSTGSGKSSFVNLIPRLYDVSSGCISIGGVDVRDIPIEELRKSIGVVLQENTLFSGTIKDNLEFGDDEVDEKLLIKASKEAQAYDFIMEKENQFESRVEQRAKNFSGGQKQRLSIARTLVRKPKILILDDSTSALDVATEGKLQKQIKDSMKQSTILMIAQRISGVMDLDRILVLEKGKVEAFGTHKELLETCDIYRNIAVSQLGEEILQNG